VKNKGDVMNIPPHLACEKKAISILLSKRATGNVVTGRIKSKLTTPAIWRSAKYSPGFPDSGRI